MCRANFPSHRKFSNRLFIFSFFEVRKTQAVPFILKGIIGRYIRLRFLSISRGCNVSEVEPRVLDREAVLSRELMDESSFHLV